ncbi:MAG: methionine ABC transporter ATP-binding protein [Spirochaetales bacterium]|nr:methionine ABC transporter ATP-binding protein [Spirochaetales bacterium]
MQITLKNLKRYYGNLHAVDDVSLTIPSNTIYGIIGKSGAGKSSLVRLVSMLERPDSGEIYYDDRRIDTLTGKDVIQERRKIGMIFQNFNLFSSRNAEQNIAYPMEICGMDREHIRKRCEDLLKVVGLDGRGKAPISTLSGGQKQRVAIARALACEPEILFCDEATSALDPQTTRAILALIKDIQKKMGLTVVMITHQMEVVRDSCSRVAVLEAGCVAEEGDVADIFASPKSEVTKDFLSNVKFSNQDIIRWSKDGGKYRLGFRGGKTDDVVISRVTMETGAMFNIRAAGVQEIKGEQVGIMIVDIDREHADVAIRALRESGVSVEETR